MEEYLKILLEQVRCQKAHPAIEAEIRGHLEDQIEANMACGMTEEEAANEAVRDMGSPIETGIALDQIHRPAMAGEMIVMMMVISTLSIILHYFMGDIGGHGIRSNFAVHTLVGFFLMLLMYRVDYSFIGRYAKIIGVVMLLILFGAQFGIGSIMIGGSYRWLCFSPLSIHFSIFAFMMLYVPLYGAILYQYYGTGMKGIGKALLWMIIPVFFSLQLPYLNLAVVLFLSLSIVFSVAVYKGWFQVSKKKFLVSYWSMVVSAPILLFIAVYKFPLQRFLADYVVARLKGYFGVGDYTYALRDTLLSFFAKSQWIGGSGQSLAEIFTDYNSTYVFTYVTSSYGILVGVVVCLLLLFLIGKTFHISFKQKNQLGTVMGCGCGSVFLVNGVMNLLHNFGISPMGESFLPFFSSGGSCIIVSYILMGMILSIYRYKNVFPIHFSKIRGDKVRMYS